MYNLSDIIFKRNLTSLGERSVKHIESAIRYANDHRQEFLNDLVSFAKIPSISTDPNYRKDIEKAAGWVSEKMLQLNLDNVKIFPTDGHPIVYADNLSAGNDAPTILIYGHYDVQPAEPLDKWDSAPFEPEIRGENIFGRGVSDMKGQSGATWNAVEAIINTSSLPVNIKFLMEGEEEIGSPNLGHFIEKNKDLLPCDFALNTDTGMTAPDLPTITYALRGLVYFEIRFRGPKQDLHSGLFGGTIHNPAQALAEFIAGLHDDDGRITLPGFYDTVQPLRLEERAELARLPKTKDWYLENTGVPALWGEPEYTPDERVGSRPTLEVNGLFAGFTGEGAKTVLPAYAMAKLSCRLVPDQNPEQVHQQMRKYCTENVPDTIKWELIKIAGGFPSISDRNAPWVKAFMKAIEDVWGVQGVFKREGGSVPVVSQFQDILEIETLNTGFGLPTDNVHGPNEKLHLPTWYKGIDTLIHFFFNVGEK
jgi:acetylornithine deacetylase/succinyl-diaminopimelate desuccinylase-like protein